MNEHSDDNVCRICFQRQDTIFSLFRKRKGSSPYDKLVNYTKIKIAIDDGGPSSICLQCLTDLDTTITFLNKCEKSNQILASRYNYDKKEISNLECEVPNDTVACFSQEESVDLELVQPRTSVVNQEVKHSELLSAESVKCSQCGSKKRCKHTPPVKHTCQYCGKVFNRKFNYTLHLKRHLGSRDWACPGCGALQLTRWLAARHCGPRARRRCPAPGCPKSFTTNTNLATHLRTHSGERPHECAECGKSFTCKNTLNDHMRIHTGVKPYICPVCGKRFATNKLSSHMLSHTSSRPHACPVSGCARAFKSARALRLHGATHAPHVRLACGACPARYNHRQSLNKHIKKHHAEKPIITEDIQITQNDI